MAVVQAQSGDHRPSGGRAAWRDMDRRSRTRRDRIWANNHTPKGIITRRERIARPTKSANFRAGCAVASPSTHRIGLGTASALRRGGRPSRRACQGHRRHHVRSTGPLSYRYAGARGVRCCRTAVDLMDAGSPVAERDLVAAPAHPTRGIRGRRPRFRCTSLVIQSLTSIWVGRTSGSPWNTTGINTGPTGPRMSKTCDGPSSSTGWTG